MKLNNWINSKNREHGASLIEFALLVALIALVAIPAIRPFALKTNDKFCDVIVDGFNYQDGISNGLNPHDGKTCYVNINGDFVNVF